jgi:hypothetical protein
MPPERLFKYTTTDGASAILSNKSLRWSSPILFNDPFDLKNYFHIDFSWSDLSREAVHKMSEMVHSAEEPTFADGNDFVSHIKSFRTKVKRSSPAIFESLFGAAFYAGVECIEKMMAKEREDWLKEKEIIRILCLAEKPDNLLMWSHYAEQHAGVVLEFKTELLESTSAHAIKVRYSDVVPTPFTYQQILDWLLGLKLLLRLRSKIEGE